MVGHHHQAIIRAHIRHQQSQLLIDQLQPVDIALHIFSMTRQIGFLDIGADKCRLPAVKLRPGDLHNLLAIDQIFPADAMGIANDISDLADENRRNVHRKELGRNLHLFINAVAHMHNLESLLIGA